MGIDWQYYVHFLSSVYLVNVGWFGTVNLIDTQTTPVPTVQTTRSSDVTSTLSITTFINDVKPICPPPGNLHLLCDVKLAGDLLTCKERLTVLKFCLKKSTNGVSDSKWSECETTDTCDIIVEFLIDNGYIVEQTTSVITSSSENSTIPLSTVITTPSISPSSSVSSTTSSNTSSISTSTSSSSSNTSDTLMTSSSQPTSSNITDVTTIPSAYNSTSSSTQYTVVTDTSRSTEFPPHSSFVYPLVGTIGVLIWVLILIWIFCCRRNKYGTPLGRERKISEEPIQEEEIEPQMMSPTRSLYSNTAFDEEEVMKEDEKIFKSYLNLRFIDDSSVECTPEKMLIS